MKYTQVNARVYRGKKLVVSVWRDRVIEDRRPGESWLEMRKRTEPDRLVATKKAINRARMITELLNKEEG